LAAVGVTFYILGYLGGLMGQVIKSAVSREREYLSDASAVQFTRNPLGLAGALKKIGGLTVGSRLRHARAAEASHFYFGNGIEDSDFRIFSTHPPLAERVKLLDPVFDGIFPKVIRKMEEVPLESVAPYRRPTEPHSAAVPGIAAAAALDPQQEPAGPAAAASVSPLEDYLLRTRKLLATIPQPVRAACREAAGAQAAMMNLLLDRAIEVRESQWAIIRSLPEKKIVAQAEELFPVMIGLGPEARLPLVDLALPALRTLDQPSYRRFRGIVEKLVGADNKVDLFEYILQQVVIGHLQRAFSPQAARLPGAGSIRSVAQPCAVILSLLARAGHAEAGQAAAAFGHAAERLFGRKGEPMALLPPAQCTLQHFDAALKKVAPSSRTVKMSLLTACLDCLTHDGEIVTVEAELFRALAAALDCPVSPWLLSA